FVEQEFEDGVRPVRPELSEGLVEDFTQVHDRHYQLDFCPRGFDQQFFDTAGCGFILKEGKSGEAIEDIDGDPVQLPRRLRDSVNSCSSRSTSSRCSRTSSMAREGPPFNRPRPYAIGSSCAFMTVIRPPESKTNTLSPGRIWYFSRTSFGITTQPFFETVTGEGLTFFDPDTTMVDLRRYASGFEYNQFGLQYVL